jgi:hypothetical protein
VATGVWPLLHRRSFETVTGPKVDWWLVQTVGVLVSVVGATLLAAGMRRRVAPELRALGIGCALGLAAIDVVHVSRGRIARVYLLDAAAEAALATSWWAAARRDGRSAGVSRPPAGRDA